MSLWVLLSVHKPANEMKASTPGFTTAEPSLVLTSPFSPGDLPILRSREERAMDTI